MTKPLPSLSWKERWGLQARRPPPRAGQGRQGARCGIPNWSRSFLPTPRCPRGAARARLGRPLRPGPAKRLQSGAGQGTAGAAGRQHSRAARPGARRVRALSHHMTLCPCSALARRVAAVSSVPKASEADGRLGPLSGLEHFETQGVPGAAAGVRSTRKVLSLYLLAIAHGWSGAQGQMAAPRAARATSGRW